MKVDYLEYFKPNINKAAIFFKKNVFDKYSGNYWIAGGSVLKKIQGEELDKDQDIDLFFPDERELHNVKNQLKDDGFEIIFENENAIKTRSLNTGVHIDLIKHYSYSLNSTISRFDFTICMCGFNNKGHFTAAPNTLKDIYFKRLKYSCNSNPFSTMKRLQKYASRGYTMDNRNLLKLSKQLAISDLVRIERELNNPSNNGITGAFLSIMYKL